MAGNQREKERKTKKRNKQQKMQRIGWGIIILVAAILIVMKIVEVDFNSIKKKYVDEEGKINVTNDIEMTPFPYNLDSSSGVRLNYQGDALNVLTDSSCTVLDPKSAKELYHFNHGYATPMIRTAGSYFCTYDQGSTRIRLDNLKDKEYENTSQTPILAADVSSSGSVIYATASNESKSAVCVMSNTMKKIMEHEVNSGYIVAVAIDSTGKRCAYAAVNTKDAKLVTTVYTINVGDEGERASFDYPGTNALDLKYCGSDLYFVGDNCVYTILNQKKQKEAFKQGSANTVCHGFTKDGELLYIYSDYSSASENHLVTVTTSGKKKKNIELSKRPKSVTSVNNEICVLFGDSIKIYSLTNGDEKGTFKCDDSVTNAYKLSSRVYISRGQQIDVIEQ